MRFQPVLVRVLGQDNFDPCQRLPDLEFGVHPGLAAQRGDLAEQFHPLDQLLVDRRQVGRRIVAQVNALQRPAAESARQVPPDGLRQERRERRDQLAGRQQALVQRPVSVQLVRRPLVAAPVPVAAAADVPVAERVGELVQPLAGREVIIRVHPLDDRRDGPVQLAQHPAIQFAALGGRAVAGSSRQLGRRQLADVPGDRSRRVEPVDIGVDHKETVDIPQPQEELRNAVLDRLFAVADRGPGRLVGEEVPTQRIRAVAVEDLRRLAVVPLALGHLAAVLAQHQAQDDAVLERVRIGMRHSRCGACGSLLLPRSRLVPEQHRADRQQAVEPAAGLIQGFADEVGGELVLEPLAVGVGIAPLGERHRAGVVPAVDDFRDALHAAGRIEWRLVSHRVDVRLVHLQVVRQFRLGGLGLFPHLDALHARLGQQFSIARDGFHLSRAAADPDRQGRAPITFAGQGPVDVGFQEVAEAAFADVLGQPGDPGVVGQHPIAERGRADKPALPRVLDQRIVVGPPAERIIVQVLFEVQQQAARPQFPIDILVRVLDPAARIIGRLGCELAVRADGADQGRTLTGDEPGLLGQQDFVVHFAEGRRLVDDARATVGRHEIRRDHAPSERRDAAGEQRTLNVPQRAVVVVERRQVAFAHQLLAAASRFHAQLAFQLPGDALHERRRDDQPLATVRVEHRGVIQFRMNGGKLVAGQRPRRGGPDQQRRLRVVD